jgi:hypothetical protein
MKRLQLVGLIFILVLGALFVFNLSKTQHKSEILNGTYKSNIDSFITMSFDASDDYTFYFYYLDHNSSNGSQQKLDQGSYYTKDNNTFVVNSSKFINQEIDYQDNKFTIIIGGEKHTFKKTSELPTILELHQ